VNEETEETNTQDEIDSIPSVPSTTHPTRKMILVARKKIREWLSPEQNIFVWRVSWMANDDCIIDLNYLELYCYLTRANLSLFETICKPEVLEVLCRHR